MDESYRGILTRADRHFDEVARDQPGALQCRLGCTLCCRGLFEIGAADVAVIADGLRALPEEARRRLVARATEVIDLVEHPDIREAPETEREEFFERTADTPCPALEANGGCAIYEHRPLVCRTFGLPIRDGASYLGQECELNFTESDAASKERAAWDLQWEDAVGAEEQYTVPEAIVLAARINGD